MPEAASGNDRRDFDARPHKVYSTSAFGEYQNIVTENHLHGRCHFLQDMPKWVSILAVRKASRFSWRLPPISQAELLPNAKGLFGNAEGLREV